MTDISRIPSSLSKITAKNGYSYQITPEDVIWLARSVQFESGNHAATAWTYAQRMVMARARSLKAMVMAHSQPINPIWRRDGSKCRPGGPYHGRDECSEQRLAARDRAAALPWSQVRPDVRAVIVKFVTGQLANPVPRAANFANAPVTQGYLSRNPASRVVLREGNWYITEASTNAWPDDFVTITSSGISPALWAVLAGVVGGIGFYFYRKKKRTGSFFGVQEDVEDVMHDWSETWHDSFWIGGGNRDIEAGPIDRRRGSAKVDTDRSGHRSIVINDYFDCADLNRSIKKMLHARGGASRLLSKYPDPAVFDTVVFPPEFSGDTEHGFGPDDIEHWEAELDDRIDVFRSVARANGCSQIAGLRR